MTGLFPPNGTTLRFRTTPLAARYRQSGPRQEHDMTRPPTLALVPLAFAASLFGACQGPQPDPVQNRTENPVGSTATAATEAEHRERVEEAWRDYEAALLDGDAARALSMYSEDVTIRGSSTLHGRAAYRENVERFITTTSLEYLKGEVEDVSVMGDHVFTAGTWSERFRPEDAVEPVSLQGAYAWLWRLEDDGEWRIYQYIWNLHPEPES